MSDYILTNGDKAKFFFKFGDATVLEQPSKLEGIFEVSVEGSGRPVLGKNEICLEGDEKKVSVPGCDYFTSAFIKPGKGEIKIQSLTDRHMSKKLTVGDKKVLLKGGLFTASFFVKEAASNPAAGTFDVLQEYKGGHGYFITENKKWKSK